jgi:hypothetical protein
MVRTQVYLTPAQHRALRTAARRANLSMTEVLRRILAERLEGKRGLRSFSKEAVLSFVGLGASGSADVAEHHDDALDQAFRDGSLR